MTPKGWQEKILSCIAAAEAALAMVRRPAMTVGVADLEAAEREAAEREAAEREAAGAQMPSLRCLHPRSVWVAATDLVVQVDSVEAV